MLTYGLNNMDRIIVLSIGYGKISHLIHGLKSGHKAYLFVN
jgi:hypothetical protein